MSIVEEKIVIPTQDDGWEELVGTQDDVWKPEVAGQELSGVITQWKDHKEYGRRWFVLTSSNELLGTPYHRVLMDRLQEISRGDVVKITFKGTVPSGKSNPAHIYKVERKKVPAQHSNN